jgi:hypothetical protein
MLGKKDSSTGEAWCLPMRHRPRGAGASEDGAQGPGFSAGVPPSGPVGGGAFCEARYAAAIHLAPALTSTNGATLGY